MFTKFFCLFFSFLSVCTPNSIITITDELGGNISRPELTPVSKEVAESLLIPELEQLEINHTNCPITFMQKDEYIFTENCMQFNNDNNSEAGSTYIFTQEQNNKLEHYEIIYDAKNVTIYEFSNYDLLKDHLYGSVTYRICENHNTNYFLLEDDWGYDTETMKLKVDNSQRMDLQEFIFLCRSMQLSQ